jgi:hypothetical protein
VVPVKKSVMPDYIICLEDGKKLKMLKRHLKTRYNMTPEEYRKRWGLPDDYPMVAPAYAEQRSSLAKKIGLGTKPRARGDAPSRERRRRTHRGRRRVRGGPAAPPQRFCHFFRLEILPGTRDRGRGRSRPAMCRRDD